MLFKDKDSAVKQIFKARSPGFKAHVEPRVDESPDFFTPGGAAKPLDCGDDEGLDVGLSLHDGLELAC